MDGSVIYKEEERNLELAELSFDILRDARNELYLNLRFLDVALSSLNFFADGQVSVTGTDGTSLFVRPEGVISVFRRGRTEVNRLFLHSILHCLFSHLWTRGDRNTEYWDLACDAAVEYVMDGLLLRAVHRPKSALRREFYRQAQDALLRPAREEPFRTAQPSPSWKRKNGEKPQSGGMFRETASEAPALTAQRLYRFLCELQPSGEQLALLKQEFTVDDHSRWGQLPDRKTPSPQQKRWEDIRDRMQMELETFGKESAGDARSLEEQIAAVNRKRYDYRDFLRKFSVLKEEMQVDPDSFDYIFYNYGMELYGNMPLIEPLETKEVLKVEDFVIVLDTSMSCSGSLLLHFLEETYSVLSESESFFRKIHVHILQCDDRVQEDVLITNRQEMQEYLEHFTVRGFGGTDFRPAFARVQELLARKCFTRLRGLIYFTDGYGVFPVKKPPYETAFVFLREDYRDVDVPPWAIRLIVDREELEESKLRFV